MNMKDPASIFSTNSGMGDGTLNPSLGALSNRLAMLESSLLALAFPGGILNDQQLKARIEAEHILTPFVDHQVRLIEKPGMPSYPVISYGLGSGGYDIRLGTHFRMVNTLPSTQQILLDPKNPGDVFIEFETSDPLIIPPHGFILAESLEIFNIPRDLFVVALNKSTYARCAVMSLVTPLEPSWRGVLTIEIVNLTNVPAVIYPLEGIIQLVFLTMQPCEVSYDDRGGKYQDQTGVTESRL